jgi:hypothetical protein
MEVIDGYNGGGDGRTVVASAGTPVQISATSVSCRRVTIQAETDNTGRIAVGLTSSIVATEGAASRGVMLPSGGDSVDVYINDLDKVYIDSTVSGDGVNYVYYTG